MTITTKGGRIRHVGGGRPEDLHDQELADERYQEGEAERLRRVECYAAYFRVHKKLPARHVDALGEGAALLAAGAVVLEPHPNTLRCKVCRDRKAITGWTRQICEKCYARERNERISSDEHPADEHTGTEAAAAGA